MTTHPTYVKMIMISMITLKKATSKEIKEHIRKTWTKLASGARFSTCFEKAISKAIGNKHLEYDEPHKKYKLTAIGKTIKKCNKKNS